MAKPSSSAPPWAWKYDVYLSFRGEDTGQNLVQHLNSALRQAEILTFWDNHELISSQGERAIEESRISIIIISRKYASSRSCLDELLKILECKERLGQQVIPIFFDVDPSQLRLQTGFAADSDGVRVALQMIGEFSGWDLHNVVDRCRYESKIIQKIVEDVSHKLTQIRTSAVRDPDEMGEKQQLRLLDISNNKILPESIRSCFSLEELQANGRLVFVEELSGSICNRIQLQSLYLNNNQGLDSASLESKQKEDVGAQSSPRPPTFPTALTAERYDHNEEAVEQDKPQGSKMKDENVEKARKLKPVELEELPEHLLRCTLHCCLFPDTYEFDKKTMVQLWVAEGFFEPKGYLMEVLAGAHFDYLIEKKFLLPSGFDCVRQSVKYKIAYESFLLHSLGNAPQVGYLKVEEARLGSVSEQIQHLFLISKIINPATFKILRRFKHLHTLVLHCQLGSSIGRTPHQLFSSVKQLRSLVLNRSGISEITSSIGDLKYLRYLDVSETPINYLPESICCLGKLQTLKLDECLNLVGLPLKLSKLANLRHLEFDTHRLNSMPANMGNLTNLQTLRAFLVGREDGYHIGELKNLINLSGSFCISRLENVLSSHEARDAAMINKKYICKLELRWTDRFIGGSKVEEEILDCLQPDACLQELRIFCYSGSVFPSWINSSYLYNIVNVFLSKCRNCLVLPSLGGLPFLKTLYMIELSGVSVIDNHFHRISGNEVYHAFPKLEKLTVDGMFSLTEWCGVENGDLPCLSRLSIVCCPKLVELRWLSRLHSLKYLEICYCDEIFSLSNEALPSLLEFLIIINCPKLKEKYGKPEASHWFQIAHVPSIIFDLKEIAKDDEEC